MPWTPESFKAKHNKSLTPAQAKKASAQANAVLRSGVPEGEAIAIANKHAKAKGSIRSDIRSAMRRGRS